MVPKTSPAPGYSLNIIGKCPHLQCDLSYEACCCLGVKGSFQSFVIKMLSISLKITGIQGK
jgi:hypothetical protein